MIYLLKLFSPHIATLNVQRETHGTKGRLGVLVPPNVGPYLPDLLM